MSHIKFKSRQIGIQQKPERRVFCGQDARSLLFQWKLLGSNIFHLSTSAAQTAAHQQITYRLYSVQLNAEQPRE